MVETGVVVIGKNEGEGLRDSLQSVLPYQPYVIYVDSGSSDNSVTLAKEMGISVLELDGSALYTPARGRNEGAKYLEEKYTQLKYLQFLDGDCQLVSGWIKRAQKVIKEKAGLGIVVGFRQEKDRNHSVFTRLLDVELKRIWEPKCGLVETTGGDMLVKLTAFNAVGKFNSEFLGGEEPELCTRMMAAGWSIYKIDTNMSLHDGSDMNVFNRIQRHLRFGWTVSEITKLYRGTRVDLYRMENKRVWLFGIVLPIVSIILSLKSFIFAVLFLLCCYFVKGVGTYREVKARGVAVKDAKLFSVDNCLGLIVQGIGKLIYYSPVPGKILNLKFGKLIYR